MNLWKTTICLFFLYFWNTSILGQFYLDTVGNYVQFRQEKDADVFAEINLGEVNFDYINVKAKGKLGSYKIRYNHTHPSIKKITILEFDHKIITFKVNDKMIRLSQTENSTNCNEIHFCSLDNDTLNNHWNLSFVKLKKELFEGGGMQFSNVIRNDYKTIYLTEENGIGRGSGSLNKWTRLAGVNGKEYSTYCPLAIIKGSDVAYEIKGHSYSEIMVSKTTVKMDIFAQDVTILLHNLTQESGISHSLSNELDSKEKLPDWALGTIVGLQGGSEYVLEKVHYLLEKGAHIDAVWIQDWVGKLPTKYGSRLQWKWQLDGTHYNNFDNFKAELKANNIKLLGYINPFFAEEGTYSEEGLQKGYFVQNELGETERFNFGGMSGYMLDIFNPAAYSWMKNIIKTNLINSGFDGWMADFGEWLPILKGKQFARSAELHNRYPVLWARLNREVINESGKELIFFNRSGGQDVQKYSNMMWIGDQLTDYSEKDGLPSVFVAYLSSAASGLPIVHSDVGGYTSVNKSILKKVVRDENLLKDWMLLEAFTPVFRTHEGLLPSENAQVYDNENLAIIFARFTNIHHVLMPYFKELGTPSNSIKPFQIENDLVGDLAFKVGNDIIIAFKPNFTMLKSIQWKLVNNEGKLSDTTLPNQKVIVMIKKGSIIERLLK